VKGGYAGWEFNSMIFSAIANSDTWLQEFTLWLDGKEVSLLDGQLVLSHGHTHDLELRVRAFSWLIDWASIALEDFSGAEALGLQFDPDLKTLHPVDGEPIHWSISTEKVESPGEFTLQLTSPDLPDRLLRGYLSNFDADKEVEVECNGFPLAFGETGYPCLGADNFIKMRVKAASPLLGKWGALTWDGDSAEILDVEVSPKTSQLLDTQWIVWTLDCKISRHNGGFSLGLKDDDGRWSTTLPLTMWLGHHFVSAERWTQIYDGPIHFYEEYGIRATSVFLNTPAPSVEVAVYRDHSSTPEYHYTDHKGEVVIIVTGTHISMSITNRYDGSIV
jgi:hypothetical protein